MRYVAGLLFSPDRERLLMIRKNRPASQAGKLNGIGGKIEAGETPGRAMDRESGEEADLAGISWQPLAILKGRDFQVDFFHAFDARIDEHRAKTDEALEIVRVSDIGTLNAMANIPVMVAIALDRSGIVRPVMLRDAIPQES